MIADIFITTKNRPTLLGKSLWSLRECTSKELYRLTVVRDGNYVVTQNVLSEFSDIVDYTITNKENEGLGPSINSALAHIDSLKRWDVDPSPLTIYLQDDVLYQTGWFEKLSKMFFLFEKQHNLGFASGIECIEHPVRKDLGGGIVLKDWIRATCMMGRHQTWMEMWPIPRIDPETGRERGRPHDGLGSSVDWWFVRNHERSICRSGRTNLVIPGLLKHLGYRDSTWLKRELPESESDKQEISRV